MGITAKELARLLNLSEAAVSLALNNRPGVSTATRKRIWDKAQELGYDFSRRAISMRMRILTSSSTCWRPPSFRALLCWPRR